MRRTLIGEQVAEQRLGERGRAGEDLADDHDGQLEEHRVPEWRAGRAGQAAEDHDLVDDQLGRPERRHGDEGPQQSQHDHRARESAMRLPDEVQELGQVTERGQSLAPRLRALVLLERLAATRQGSGDHWVSHR
jgi:hypothetical protein